MSSIFSRVGFNTIIDKDISMFSKDSILGIIKMKLDVIDQIISNERYSNLELQS